MISPGVVRSLIGIVGNVITVRLFLLPAERFLKIVKKRSVGELSPDPFLATLLNCMLWVFYALPLVRPDSMLVVTVNGAGLLIEAVYVGIFLVFVTNKERLRMLAVLGVEAAFMATLVSGVLLCAQTHAVRSMIVGSFCVIANSVMYVSPLTVMKKVVETKSVEHMPFFLSLMALLNGTCWTAYAFIKLDVYIAIPNGLCVLFSLAQLIRYFCYGPKKVKNVELERQAQRHAKPYKWE